MGGLLFGLLRLSVKTATQFVGVALARTLVPRFPPQNYKPQERHQQSPQTLSPSEPYSTVGVTSKLFGPSEMLVRPAEPQTPTQPCGPVSYLQPSIEIFDYAPVCSPSKAMYITPIRSLYSERSVDVNMVLLRAASDKINSILEQSRRRVDAGEDHDSTRREARRKRTQELCGLLPSAL
ncbi:hypothetical protein CPB83DRAFT_890021 [Crepidotus variabilis]|uniref:Uncharacterized protein n=1 Tax=Crepidotus variabilis TaxID=179855 RepID=A0A9P6EQU2_9AGAR|nr:hypothetical protein CPB83DRAFT_890021 [Crepidotus variabilis]